MTDGSKSSSDSIDDVLQPNETQREEMLQGAVAAYGEGDYTEAEQILVGLLAAAPNEVRATKLLASTLWLQDEHERAEHYYIQAHHQDPEDLYIVVALAECYLRTLRLEEGIGLLEKLFEADPDHKHPAANRGRQLAREYHRKLSEA